MEKDKNKVLNLELGDYYLSTAYNELCFLQIHGNLDKNLNDIAKTCITDFNMELSPVRPIKKVEGAKGSADYMRGFHFAPPNDLLIQRAKDGRLILWSRSWNDGKHTEGEAFDYMEFVEKIKLIPEKPSDFSIESFMRQVRSWTDYYHDLVGLYDSKPNKSSFGLRDFFGAQNYGTFLAKFCGMSNDESIRFTRNKYREF